MTARYCKWMISCPSLFLSSAVLLAFSVTISISRCHALLLPPLHSFQARRRIIKTPNISPRIALAPHSIAPTSIAVKQDESITSTSNSGNPRRNRRTNEKVDNSKLGTSFSQKLNELRVYQRQNGHCLVPKRYKSNPSLGNWVNKQRQNYKKFLKGEKSSMNQV